MTRLGSAASFIFIAIFLFSVLNFFYFLAISAHHPALDYWGFRPAQTLVSVPYMLSEGAWFRNIVPVFGEPWIYPQEFPLYQWLVAVTVWVSGASVSSAGRVVSGLFAVATILPIHLLGKTAFCNHRYLFTAVISSLWLTSPVVVFWGRAPLIETTAIFFSLFWLVYYIRYMTNGSVINLLGCITLGCIAAMVKVTPFVGFVTAAFLFSMAKLYVHKDRLIFKRFLLSGLCVLLPAIALVAWSRWTNSIWLENPLSSLMRVSGRGIYFGVPSDRWSPDLWSFAIGSRTLPHYFGNYWYILLLAFAVVAVLQKKVLFSAALGASFIAGYLIFPRLFIYNNYYEIETVFFVLAFMGVLICSAFVSGKHALAIALVVAAVGFQVSSFYGSPFNQILRSDLKDHPYYLAAEKVKAETSPDSVVVVFGTGWGADIPFLSERRGVVLANMFSTTLTDNMFINERSKWLGGRDIGAVVVCEVFESQLTSANLLQTRDKLTSEMVGDTVDFTAPPGPDMMPAPHCRVHLSR